MSAAETLESVEQKVAEIERRSQDVCSCGAPHPDVSPEEVRWLITQLRLALHDTKIVDLLEHASWINASLRVQAADAFPEAPLFAWDSDCGMSLRESLQDEANTDAPSED